MLTEERYQAILDLLEEEGSVTIQQLMTAIDVSESTVRRDLNAMAKKGLLQKVYGGALSKERTINTIDEEVQKRKEMFCDEKSQIAKYAAEQIVPKDFVYLDAGTTTERMIDYLVEKEVTFVTNAIGHAKKLSGKGYQVYLLGGEFKGRTEAIVGEEAMICVEKFNFTKGFFGTNGMSIEHGFTTPEYKEAMVKKKAMEHCKQCFVLADSSKFSAISSVKFGEFENAMIITNHTEQVDLSKWSNIKEV